MSNSYDHVIKDQLRDGIIQVVEEPQQLNGNRVHYLPHHAVIRQQHDTTKVRVVYDASAKSQGPSLNNCLHVGPKSNQKIFEILLRFRIHQFALTADIERAFLMMSVAPEDCDVLRFLWVNNILHSPPEVQVYRFTRVVFGVASSPFLLNATLRHHIEKYQETDPHLVQQLLRSFYVDDVVCGADGEESTYLLYLKSKKMLSEGGFNLRKFTTNDLRLQRRIDNEENPSLTGDLGMEEEDTYTKSTLGLSQVLHGRTKGLRYTMGCC